MRKLFASFFILLIFIFSQCSNREIVNNTSLEVVKKFNSKCPMMVDSETRIDAIEIKKPNTILYKYTLVNLNVENVDTAAFGKALKPGIVSTLKTNTDLKDLKALNASFEYYYQDRKGKFIYLFVVTPKQYKP